MMKAMVLTDGSEDGGFNEVSLDNLGTGLLSGRLSVKLKKLANVVLGSLEDLHLIIMMNESYSEQRRKGSMK